MFGNKIEKQDQCDQFRVKCSLDTILQERDVASDRHPMATESKQRCTPWAVRTRRNVPQRSFQFQYTELYASLMKSLCT